MPFLPFDFASHDSTEVLHQQLRQNIDEICRSSRILCTVIGVRSDYEKPKTEPLRCLAQVQKVLIVILFFCVLINVVLLARDQNPALIYAYVGAALDLCFMLWWNFFRLPFQVHNQLLATSSGVGLLRRRNHIHRINGWACAAGGLYSALLVAWHVVGLLSPEWRVDFESWSIITGHSVQLLLVLPLAVAIPATNSLFFSHVEVVRCEFLAHNEDFTQDVNAYQLPVSRHYVHAHWRLLTLWDLLRTAFSLWLSSRLLLVVLGVPLLLWPSIETSGLRLKNLLLDEDRDFKGEVLPLMLSLGLLVTVLLHSVLHTAALLVSAIQLRKSVVGLRHAFTRLVAGDKTLHDQTYSLLIAYSNQLRFHRYGIGFFGLTVVDRQFVNLLLAIASFLVLSRLFGD